MFRDLSTYSRSRWIGLAVTLGLCFGTAIFIALAVSGLAIHWAIISGSIALLSGSGTLLLFAILYRKLSFLQADILKTCRELNALINVRPVLGPFPVRMNDWAAHPVLSEHLIHILAEKQPQLVLECGSGSSTVLIAACLSRLGRGRVVSLDHDPEYAERTRRLLVMHDVNDFAEVITAPLKEIQLDGDTYIWYDFAPSSLSARIDVLFVDGPPGEVYPLARYPALPLCAPQMNSTWIVVMDDGSRQAETWIAKRWSQQWQTEIEYIPEAKGIWTLRSGPSTESKMKVVPLTGWSSPDLE